MQESDRMLIFGRDPLLASNQTEAPSIVDPVWEESTVDDMEQGSKPVVSNKRPAVTQRRHRCEGRGKYRDTCLIGVQVTSFPHSRPVFLPPGSSHVTQTIEGIIQNSTLPMVLLGSVLALTFKL